MMRLQRAKYHTRLIVSGNIRPFSSRYVQLVELVQGVRLSLSPTSNALWGQGEYWANRLSISIYLYN